MSREDSYIRPRWESEERPHVECERCGIKLYAGNGQKAWYIGEAWFCNDCAKREFRKVVFL